MRSATRFTNSTKKTAATVTATFKVQYAIEDGDAVHTVAAFQKAVDTLAVLRRTSSVTENTTPAGLLELHCSVEYGPSMGGYESDLRRQLERIMESTNAIEGEVFNAKRSEMTQADLDRLTARVDDLNVPLRARKYLAERLARTTHDKNAT